MNLYAITFLLNSFLFTYSLRILYGFSFLSLVEKMWIWSHFVKRHICGYYVLYRCLAWRGQSLFQWTTPLALYFLSKFLQWLILARPERTNHLQVIILVHLFFIPATQSPGWSSLIFTRLSLLNLLPIIVGSNFFEHLSQRYTMAWHFGYQHKEVHYRLWSVS